MRMLDIKGPFPDDEHLMPHGAGRETEVTLCAD